MVMVYFFLDFSIQELSEKPEHVSSSIVWFILCFPIHIVATCFVYYCVYIVAKTYKTIELNRTVSFGSFVGEFFLILFLPIGIWFLQPK